jgi:hypothetical protein
MAIDDLERSPLGRVARVSDYPYGANKRQFDGHRRVDIGSWPEVIQNEGVIALGRQNLSEIRNAERSNSFRQGQKFP